MPNLWNCLASMSTSWDMCISGLVSAILNYLLPLTRYVISISLIKLPVPKNMNSHWNHLAIMYTSLDLRYFTSTSGYRPLSLIYILLWRQIYTSLVLLPEPGSIIVGLSLLTSWYITLLPVWWTPSWIWHFRFDRTVLALVFFDCWTHKSYIGE